MQNTPPPRPPGENQSVTSQLVARAIRPEVVGRYELLLELASGGMGAVFLGRQHGAAGFERLVAIKRMHRHLAHDPHLIAAFHDEAKIASLIRHPNVVTVVDVYEQGGEHLLVMEYVDGASVSSLAQSARRRGMKLPRAISIRLAIDALRGLSAAHSLTSLEGTPLSVVHRDVSPQNILVASDGAVRLTDFGIARAIERTARTTTGELKGKFRYMSPEQARGGAVDARTDLFSLGIVLWELLVGDKLYSAESDIELLKLASEARIAPPRSHDPSLPPELDAFVMQLLSTTPDARPRDAAAAADALERLSWQLELVAKPSDVARAVEELVGDRLRSRRALATDMLHGRRLPELVDHGRTPVTSLAAQSAPSITPRGRGSLIVAAIGAAAVVGLSAALLIHATSTDAPASSAASAKTTAAPASPASDVVTVEIASTATIIGVRGPAVANVRFGDQGATFTLPRGTSPVTIVITTADGAVSEQRVTPDANVAVRLVGAASATTATAAATVSAGAPPIRRLPPDRPPALKPNPFSK